MYTAHRSYWLDSSCRDYLCMQCDVITMYWITATYLYVQRVCNKVLLLLLLLYSFFNRNAQIVISIQ